MKITGVHCRTLQLKEELSSQPSWLSEAVIANPMSLYPRYAARRSSWMAPFSGLAVLIDTDEGIQGLAVADGGAAVQIIIEQHFARLLVGEDPSDIELLWDQMFRASLPYGRKGLSMFAISAVDCALWDILGKALQQPVYRLLGGATKEDMPVYETTNDRVDWDNAAFFGVKLAMPYGPADGREGLLKNRDLVKECRERIGEKRDIMLDCYMAWDVEYTIRMIDLVEPYGVRWIEEALTPDNIHGYEKLARYTGPIALATGEHEYSRWGHRDLLATGAISVFQPDINWVGGITETRKICAMASAWGLIVCPHAGGLQAAGLHLIKSQVNCPFAEWVRTWNRDSGRPAAGVLGIPDPIDGRIRPGEEPGLGMHLNEDVLRPA
ncbi:L-rhamnonate dehydratase [Dictyobacter alpinus]|uniref:L-rhamnonate dehydratase n=1 Tax=Dictyobacter alpinus TaxID=2014873 RepID=A0A402BKL6_9CHLR|nr:enolase C-terminal domain-like protein [Dictyobacter alpinus]GCE31866.1 L-rhamnonate dehydratase [Dictyobacter alpinus]